MKVNGVAWRSIAEDGPHAVRIVDQTRLPFAFETLRLQSCDEAIDPRRLQAHPAALRCAQCQGRFEAAKGRTGPRV
jgi:Zn finger protein HypA/HybF involved in hydrogenase expression